MNVLLVNAHGSEIEPCGELAFGRACCIEACGPEEKREEAEPGERLLHIPIPQWGQRTAACNFLLPQLAHATRFPWGRLNR